MQKIQENLILVVDDVPTNIKILFHILTQQGFSLCIAESGEIALEKVKEVLPELILLDVIMPGIDGFETCRCLKANSQTRDIPVIFMTASSQLEDKVRGLQLGAVDYITKPLEAEEVLARINVHLKLRRMQLKLVQEEKMSSLGQLVAGVAHEINNPVSFIYGNLPHAQKYITELLTLIHLYEVNTPHAIPEVAAYARSIDLDFLKQDLPQLLNSMEVGTFRIQEIVRSLRLFSRLDEAECKVVDIHEGIDSTLMILSSRLKSNRLASDIQVVKAYGDLPTVECYPGQLNQVFMNLLSNAIDAVEESFVNINIKKIPMIGIRTQLSIDEQHVLIQFSDNGVGMSKVVQSQIFEQFFTTKAVGKGTGLGLAIAHEIIVDKHGGTITVNSHLGEGSEFTIAIPVKPVPR